MKRFILFAGDKYYPIGGRDYFYGSYDTLEELKGAEAEALKANDWTNCVDAREEEDENKDEDDY